MRKVDCAIIGAGPAGLACALQAKRQGLQVALFEKHKAGGQALAANKIENYPGFPMGITGRELMDRFISQTKSCSVEILHEEVKNAKRSEHGFTISTDKTTLDAKTLVVASGLVPKRLGVPGEYELEGRHIFYYANPDDIPHEAKDVLIIGSGDAAFDQALSYVKRAKSVSIAMQYSNPCCNPPLLQNVNDAQVEVLPSRDILSVYMEADRVVAEFENSTRARADLIIACVGKMRCFGFLDGDILEAPSAGVFFAGDCHRNKDRHISIAIGDGVSAAMAATEYINCEKSETGETSEKGNSAWK